MEKKQVKNLVYKLFVDKNSILYGRNIKDVTDNFINKKLSKSKYNKDVFFYNLLSKQLSQLPSTGKTLSSFLEEEKEKKHSLPTVLKKINTREYNRHSTLFSVQGPLELLHADIADINYLKPSASEPKYILLLVDLFSSYVYTYGLKNRKNLHKKLQEFYEKINSGTKKNQQHLRIQTDLEFTTSLKIKDLNEKYNVEMFTTKLNRGHAFAAEQKIRVIKELLLRLRRNNKRKNLYDLIKSATYNLNNTPTEKYRDAIPSKVQDLTLKDNSLKNLYNSFRLERVQKSADRYDRYDFKKNSNIKNFQKILEIGDRVLVASYRLLKKTDPGVLDKKTTDKKSYFNRNRTFEIIARYKTSTTPYHYYYRVKEVGETNKIISGRFNRNDLYKIQ